MGAQGILARLRWGGGCKLGAVIKAMVPTAQVVTVDQEDNRNYRVRFDKIYNLLNFQPKYSVQDGITEIVDAFATGQLVDYREPRYSNLAFLNDHSDLPQTLLQNHGRRDWDTLQTGDVEMQISQPVVQPARPGPGAQPSSADDGTLEQPRKRRGEDSGVVAPQTTEVFPIQEGMAAS